MGDTQTDGGASVGNDVSTGGGNFAGRDSQRNNTTINVDSNAIYLALADLANRMGNLESMVAMRFMMAEGQRDTTKDQIEELHEELKRLPLNPAVGPGMQTVVWSMWALTFAMMFFAGVIVWASLHR